MGTGGLRAPRQARYNLLQEAEQGCQWSGPPAIFQVGPKYKGPLHSFMAFVFFLL